MKKTRKSSRICFCKEQTCRRQHPTRDLSEADKDRIERVVTGLARSGASAIGNPLVQLGAGIGVTELASFVQIPFWIRFQSPDWNSWFRNNEHPDWQWVNYTYETRIDPNTGAPYQAITGAWVLKTDPFGLNVSAGNILGWNLPNKKQALEVGIVAISLLEAFKPIVEAVR